MEVGLPASELLRKIDMAIRSAVPEEVAFFPFTA
jgi:hypothetical protein